MFIFITFYLECMLSGQYKLVQRSDCDFSKELIYEYTKLSEFVQQKNFCSPAHNRIKRLIFRSDFFADFICIEQEWMHLNY